MPTNTDVSIPVRTDKKTPNGPRPRPFLQPLLNRIEHCATRLGVSRSWLYREIGAGRLTVIKLGTRSLITEAELNRFATHLAIRGSKEAV